MESRLTDLEVKIKGRQLRLNQMRSIYDKYEGMMTDKDRKNLFRAITKTEQSITNLKNKKTGRLLIDVFDPNPMMNRWIAVNNLLLSLRRNA